MGDTSTTPIRLWAVGASPRTMPARKLFRCKGEESCGKAFCVRCNPEVEKVLVACDECGAPEYLYYAQAKNKWEWCDICGAHFCPECGPILVSDRGQRLCSLCRED